ncbi:MAG: transcriptional regulator [Deltaproteobacteria bacterium]|nr:MAG: transcriptional regulator [Deltaproteobacteria bacterium]
MRVLGLLDGRQPQSVAEIRQRLEQEGSELAYTTVMTVLKRLYDKGLVTRQKESRRHLYSVNQRAPKVKQGVLARVHRALFHGDRLQPLVALVEQEDLSKDELVALRRAIDAQLEARKP